MTITMTIIITIHIFFSRCNQQTCGSHRLPVTEAQVRAMEATQATRRPTHDPAPWLRPVDTNKDVPQKWCFYGDFMVKMVILWWRWRLYGEDGDFMVKMAIVWWRWRFYGEDCDFMVSEWWMGFKAMKYIEIMPSVLVDEDPQLPAILVWLARLMVVGPRFVELS